MCFSGTRCDCRLVLETVILQCVLCKIIDFKGPWAQLFFRFGILFSDSFLKSLLLFGVSSGVTFGSLLMTKVVLDVILKASTR